jgi:hypothetical protein
MTIPRMQPTQQDFELRDGAARPPGQDAGAEPPAASRKMLSVDLPVRPDLSANFLNKISTIFEACCLNDARRHHHARIL